eukprot:scaffold582_cov385-Prasinococcus_capsulatus_cf.AAC.28
MRAGRAGDRGAAPAEEGGRGGMAEEEGGAPLVDRSLDAEGPAAGPAAPQGHSARSPAPPGGSAMRSVRPHAARHVPAGVDRRGAPSVPCGT